MRGTVVDAALIAQAPKLKVVVRHGVGYDLVDVPALTARGIALMITPEANAASVAEHALMLMLSVARRVLPVDAGVRRGEWRGRASPPPSSWAARADPGLRAHRHARGAAVRGLRHAGGGA